MIKVITWVVVVQEETINGICNAKLALERHATAVVKVGAATCLDAPLSQCEFVQLVYNMSTFMYLCPTKHHFCLTFLKFV